MANNGRRRGGPAGAPTATCTASTAASLCANDIIAAANATARDAANAVAAVSCASPPGVVVDHPEARAGTVDNLRLAHLRAVAGEHGDLSRLPGVPCMAWHVVYHTVWCGVSCGKLCHTGKQET